MSVSFTLPLQRAWNRMVRILFRPFRLRAWLVLGFAAFLSEYLSDFAGPETHLSWSDEDGMGASKMIRAAAAFLLHPVWGPLAFVVVVVLVLAVLALLWVSSRGKFVFLDDVVRERPGIADPWKRYGSRGDALFVWWLVFLVACVVVILGVSLPLLPAILAAIADSDFRILAVASLLGWAALMVPIALVIAYTLLFLFQFVVPIMYVHGIGVNAAWGRFLPLFRRHPGAFLLYGLLYLAISIVVAIAVGAVGFATCCVGFLVLAIPYVGAVILLPVEILLRGLGPEFLAQFGPELSVFGAPPPAPAPPSPLPLAGGPPAGGPA